MATDKRLLVGIDSRDDAGVFQISEDLALVQTVDFFSPIVDDPYDYGQIAAANSLSDIYAMGGEPLTALCVVGFPINTLDKHILRDILRGGLDKAQEAGVSILGGHSVRDPEIKYGLAVTALMSPRDIVRNNTPDVGDHLILTKALGTGVLSTALKRENLSSQMLKLITDTMKQLNRQASKIMREHQVSACTDVTGFGLLGHLYEMTLQRDISAKIYADQVPILPEVIERVERQEVPGGLKANRKYISNFVEVRNLQNDALFSTLCDPQTSGGLLFTVPPSESTKCLQKLHAHGITNAAIIGEITEHQGKPLIL